jgi:hypothetical protein
MTAAADTLTSEAARMLGWRFVTPEQWVQIGQSVLNVSCELREKYDDELVDQAMTLLVLVYEQLAMLRKMESDLIAGSEGAISAFASRVVGLARYEDALREIRRLPHTSFESKREYAEAVRSIVRKALP